MADLHALLRRRRLNVFVDVKALGRALRKRTPLALARRMAEYVLIDNRRVPIGLDEHAFLERELARVHSVRNGLGYSSRATPLQPAPLVSYGRVAV